MNITIIGSGYVGLVTGTCLAVSGHRVTCLDANSAKVDALARGELPIHEPGLKTLLNRALELEQISFTADASTCLVQPDAILICVDTPSDARGECHLGNIDSVAEQIGALTERRALVILKSTAPVGTCARLSEKISASAALRDRTDLAIDVISNPEFLKEGSAIADFTNPDRVLIGIDRPELIEEIAALYAPFPWASERLLVTDTASSEMIKYASNAMLALRIAFMNEIAELCETSRADIEEVRRGMSADKRIGAEFLRAGIGFGGSCLPKDLRALAGMHRSHQLPGELTSAVINVNQRQRERFAQTIGAFFAPRGGIADRTVAIWGLTFKAGTDDLRESPALVISALLLQLGARLRLFDPIAEPQALLAALGQRSDHLDRVRVCSSAVEAAGDADAIALLTDWPEFRDVDFAALSRQMSQAVLFDGRNHLVDLPLKQWGFDYIRIGQRPSHSASLDQQPVISARHTHDPVSANLDHSPWPQGKTCQEPNS